jgi:hypothetical protein
MGHTITGVLDCKILMSARSMDMVDGLTRVSCDNHAVVCLGIASRDITFQQGSNDVFYHRMLIALAHDAEHPDLMPSVNPR